MKIFKNQYLGLAVAIALVFMPPVVISHSPENQVSTIRFLVITIFSLLPALMYFVFIALRKTSLFQEYVSNLYRLGYLTSSVCPDNDEDSRNSTHKTYYDNARIQGYVKRFESVYGPIDKKSVQQLLRVSTGSGLLAADSIKSSVDIDEERPGHVFSYSTAMPVYIATLLFGIGWFMLIPPHENVEASKGLKSVLALNESVVLFGFLGAYFYSIQMLFRRFVTNDLRAKAYISVSIRVVLAIVATWVVQSLFVEDVSGELPEHTNIEQYLPAVAFLIGFFPAALWGVIKNVLVGKFAGVLIPRMESPFKLTELDGLTFWHQSRLEEEDIENGFNMANADIINLLLNTKYPTSRIVDWVDQAVLLSTMRFDDEEVDSKRYLEAKARMQTLGVRRATTLDGFSERENVRGELSDSVLQNRGVDEVSECMIHSLIGGVSNYDNIQAIRRWRFEHAAATNGNSNVTIPS